MDYINAQFKEVRPYVTQVGEDMLQPMKKGEGLSLRRRAHPSRLPVLESLRYARNVLDAHHAYVSEAIEACEEVLEDPALMFQMEFWHNAKDPSSLDSSDYEEVEHLFDIYLQAMETTLAKLQGLRGEVEALYDIKMLHLDQSRNTLMRIELVFSIITSFAAIGA